MKIAKLNALRVCMKYLLAKRNIIIMSAILNGHTAGAVTIGGVTSQTISFDITPPPAPPNSGGSWLGKCSSDTGDTQAVVTMTEYTSMKVASMVCDDTFTILTNGAMNKYVGHGTITTDSPKSGTYRITVHSPKFADTLTEKNIAYHANVCSADINTNPTIPDMLKNSVIDIPGMITNTIGNSTMSFKPGNYSSEMQKGVLTTNGEKNGYYSINNDALNYNGEWVVKSDSNPTLRISTVPNASPGVFTGTMTATLSCQ